MKRTIITLLSIFLLAPASYAQIQPGPINDLLDHYNRTYSSRQSVQRIFGQKVVAKAPPDECNDNGTVGVPDPAGYCSQGSPKVNQAYIWGMTQSNNIWFGTAANVLCLVAGYMSQTPIDAPSFACEFGGSDFLPSLPAALGDWRPPHIYEFNPATQELTDRTPLSALDLVNTTLGLRSAGSRDGVVLLAGPSLDSTAINVFAFSDNGTFLGSQSLPQYNNIRQWVNIDGVLYTGVSTTADNQGRVLRWNGSLADPFNFEVVGRLDLDAANIAFHDGRIFITTWPALSGGGLISGLWMSRVIPPGGLTGDDNDTWQKVWTAADYEPDPIVARTYAGGALASFDGNLYWGTLHVPFISALTAGSLAQKGVINLKGSDNVSDTQDALATVLGTYRAISIFSGRNFGTTEQTIELLYGDRYLPVYDNESRSYTIAYDQKHQNKMPNPVPRLGPSGIGNFWNTYTWTMGVGFKNSPSLNKLLIGTFDWSYVADQLIEVAEESLSGDPLSLYMLRYYIDQLPEHDFGADLLMVNSPDSPFVLVSNNGLENYLNYGIRTMLVPDGSTEQDADNETMYLGLANPFNLATEADKKKGGWELVQLYKVIAAPPGDTTTSITSTTTTMPTSSTTTIPDGKKTCPLKKTMGADNPNLEKIRAFRNGHLAQNAVGRMIISIYYNNADTFNAALDRSPLLRALARRICDAVSSQMDNTN